MFQSYYDHEGFYVVINEVIDQFWTEIIGLRAYSDKAILHNGYDIVLYIPYFSFIVYLEEVSLK